MEITFACEDAIAQSGAKGIMNGYTFVEVIGMFDQNTMDVLWLVKQDARERPKMHAADIALSCHTLQETQTIITKIG